MQVEVLLGIAEKNDETLTALAIRSGGKELEASVSNAIQRLKASEVSGDEGASRPALLGMEDGRSSRVIQFMSRVHRALMAKRSMPSPASVLSLKP